MVSTGRSIARWLIHAGRSVAALYDRIGHKVGAFARLRPPNPKHRAPASAQVARCGECPCRRRARPRSPQSCVPVLLERSQAIGEMMATLEHLMVEANKDGRMCPQPMVWNRLWELLSNAPGLPYPGRDLSRSNHSWESSASMASSLTALRATRRLQSV